MEPLIFGTIELLNPVTMELCNLWNPVNMEFYGTLVLYKMLEPYNHDTLFSSVVVMYILILLTKEYLF